MYSYFIFCYRIIIIILLSKNIYLINANSCCPLLVTLDPHHSLKYNNIEYNLLTSKSYLVIIISYSLHVCDNITLYKSWLFKFKSEDVSTKYQ